ncbi:uncharacterized protein BKA78DRAFT_164076 [Phyllosticta capitalensis]|uniref:uncharacterized protein n=1 Tax=Phyllosticta capitalensis TaxID=121624 RepID=UPI003131DB7F
MPHKHKRKGPVDDAAYDLAPNARAKPLPVRDSNTLSENFASKTRKRTDKKKNKRIEGYGVDDTPKAFARLMKLSQTGKGFKGLDNGDEPRGKKRKLNGNQPAVPQSQPPAKQAEELPKIMPGEKMSDFAARVDRTLPVAGLARKGKSIEGHKGAQTRLEKKIQKKISKWREDEEKLREAEEERRELAEEEDDEVDAMFGDKTDPLAQGAGKKSKRKRRTGEVGDDDDPWAVLKAKREAPKGINDVVQAPPTFTAIPKEKFKVKNGAKVQVDNIPNTAGSLRRREELGEARKSVIENYRAMMDAKRKG